jgi:ribosomal protein S18 acetylase RimI-like enzyme
MAEPIPQRTLTATLRPLQAADATASAALSLAAFERYIAPDWGAEACERYRLDTEPEAMLRKIVESPLAIGAFVDAALAGFVLMTRPGYVQMWFVAPQWMGQGIGRALWETLRDRLETERPEVRTIELNASPYAFAFYRRLGFVPLSSEYINQGFRATRMACWLPARELGAELAPD